MRCDYSAADVGLITKILDENSRRLSRTRGGVSDTRSNVEKKPLRLAGEALRLRAADNERQVQRFIYDVRKDAAPQNGKKVLDLLWTIADLTNDGLLPTSQKLRTWSDFSDPAIKNPRVTAADLPSALEEFSTEISERWHELAHDPVLLTSWAEWELCGGSLHPFYDGCGRIARSFSAMLLVRAHTLLPLYDDRGSYFKHGAKGAADFASYVSRRIGECESWLQEHKKLFP